MVPTAYTITSLCRLGTDHIKTLFQTYTVERGRGRKSIDCEKVPRLRPLVLLVRVRVKVKALE
jgi:hypothetical protein